VFSELSKLKVVAVRDRFPVRKQRKTYFNYEYLDGAQRLSRVLISTLHDLGGRLPSYAEGREDCITEVVIKYNAVASVNLNG
jgi:hypothetical protein